MAKIKSEDKQGSSIADIILEDDDNDCEYKVNTFQDSLRELGEIHYRRYPKKDSNISSIQRQGIVAGRVMNEYSARNFGYSFKAIDVLIEDTLAYAVSENGFGIVSFNELVSKISATFEQTQIPDGLRGLMRK